MGCGTCGSGGCSTSGTGGCRSNGGCSTGGCNKLNTFDWLSDLPYSSESERFKIVEVSFKNGSRKNFYRNLTNIDCHTGDLVVLEGNTGGYDIGRISLSGELVRLQMRKKRVSENADLGRVLRVATQRDIDRWEHAQSMEYSTMLLSRVIARNLNLNMKIGDVEYQADGRKATFYYIADERVDFRELIKQFAREFKVRIEMRQIGARQEAGRIGGIGTCGRELCCSTWLTDFKSVSTAAARYQNLAINQSKLSGQCGRLKCCLNYELDTYMDALQNFPRNAEYLRTKSGSARLVKTDIFKRKLWYSLPDSSNLYALTVEQVLRIQEMNKNGEEPEGLKEMVAYNIGTDIEFEDGVGEIKLAELGDIRKKKRRRKNRKRKEGDRSGGGKASGDRKPESRSGRGNTTPKDGNKRTDESKSSRPNEQRRDGGRKPGAKKVTTTKGGNSPRKEGPRKPRPKMDGTKPPRQKTDGGKPKSKMDGTKPPRQKMDGGKPKAKMDGAKPPRQKTDGGKPNQKGKMETGKPKQKGESSKPPVNKNVKKPMNKQGPKKPDTNKPPKKD